MNDAELTVEGAATAHASIEEFKNYIGGEWVASCVSDRFDNINPADTSDTVGRFQASAAAAYAARHACPVAFSKG
jgi:aldehyde dehydrogenase (NAD+)